MELLNAISSRRAIRSYKDTSIEDFKLEQILKTGCAAPIPEDYTAVSGIAVGYASEEVEPKELSLSIHVDVI